MAVTIKHEDLTNAAPNPSALVDGPKWDKAHTVEQTGAGVLGATGAGTVDVLTASAARTLLEVDQAGTDNSTDVTVSGAYDYITLSGQDIVRGQVNLEAHVTGTLPAENGGFDGVIDSSDTINGQSLFWDTSTDPNQWTKAFRSPRDPTADLRDFLPDGYTVSSGTAGSGTDVVSYVHNALDAIRARYGRGKLLWPPQRLRISNTIDATKLAGIMVEGWGSQASSVHYDNNAGPCFFFTGAGGYTGGGLKGLAIVIDPAHTSSTSTAVSMDGDSSFQGDQTIFEDLYITILGSGRWYNGFFAFGNDRTSPQGIRVTTLKNIQIFGCTNLGFYGSGIIQWSIENLGTYVGTGGGMDFYLAGGGTASTNSKHVSCKGLNIGGTINATNTTEFWLEGSCAAFVTNSSFDLGGGVIRNGGSTTGVIGSNTDLTVI